MLVGASAKLAALLADVILPVFLVKKSGKHQPGLSENG
jgi:hypothetical protein